MSLIGLWLGTDELKMEVARTCHVLAMSGGKDTDCGKSDVTTGNGNDAPILVGYLWKKSQSASRSDEANGTIWHRRWFCLKKDNYCLYYYKHQDVSQWNYSETAPKLLQNCSVTLWNIGTPMHSKNCSKTTLKLLHNCSITLWKTDTPKHYKTALKLLWNCSKTAL